MIIQLNTDKESSGNARLESYLNTTITKELSRFKDYVTRVEVHLSDENGSKKGENDKRCLLEARLKNKNPIAVTSNANTIEEAISDALGRLKNSIETIKGKAEAH
jgi:ribosome-associated translation inhibitor RaiA